MDVTSGLGYPRKTQRTPQNRITRLAGPIDRSPRSHRANATGAICRNPREKRGSRSDRRSADILAISSSEQRFRYIPLQRIPGISGVNEASPWPICYVATPAWASRLSRCRISGLKGSQGMANSSTSPILVCVNSTVSGGSYAQVHYHPDTRPGLPLRQRLLPAAPGLTGQRQSHGHDPLDGPLRCRGADLLDLRDLPPPDRRPQRGGLRQGPLRPALLPRSTQTQGQRRLRRPPAQGPAPPPQATTPR